ncbi:hypothetical protein DW945_08060 [Parabacteroides sp. AM44-16]|nr:hypothetical protein DW945_08060 [Parabacteroides sp. AM44-16]
MANVEVVKNLIISILHESKGIARTSLVNNIVKNYGSGISAAELTDALDDLMSADIIESDGTFYTLKK